MRSTGIRPASMWIVAAAALLASCSALQPHIFSERAQLRLDAEGKLPATNPDISLDEAYLDAQRLQRRYIAAIADQGNLPAQLSVAGIGLAAVSLFKGLTHPNTNDLAAVGVIGSAGVAYSSTLLSRTRLGVYRAGVEALSCAMLAVEPLRMSRGTLGRPGDASSAATLYGAVSRAQEASLELQALTDEMSPLREPQLIDLAPAPAPTARVGKQGTPDSCASIVDPSPSRRKALMAQCRAAPAATPSSPASAATGRATPERPSFSVSRSVTVSPPESLLRAFTAAEREISRADLAAQSAGEVTKVLTGAGPALESRSLAIQLAVSAEVDKTVPDPSAALRAAQGMPEVANILRGLGAASPTLPTGQAEGGGDRKRTGTDADYKAERKLRAATLKLARARLALEQRIQPFSGITERGTRDALNACSVRVTGVELKVSPAEDDIPVALGTSAVFFVSGGGGPPSAAVVVGPAAPMLPKIDGGQFRFEYVPPTSAQPGEIVVIRFTDGSGQVSRFVSLRLMAGKQVADENAKPAPNANSTSASTPRANTTPVAATAGG